jgi:sporulation protein YlmC with PRC-barrel domain
MLRHAKELEDYALKARDGKIGHVHDFIFDDSQWTVRYLVVATGPGLEPRKVLVSPAAVSRTEWDERLISVNLTQDQVRQSPPLDPERSLSREQEALLAQYYNWPVYWGAPGFPDMGLGLPVPLVPILTPAAERSPEPATGAAEAIAVQEEQRTHRIRVVTDYAIAATDGEIGHVADFLIDDRSWDIRYLIVDTRNWWPGKKVIVAPQWIRAVGWDEGRVHVSLTRQAIKDSPPYDPTQPVTPDYAGLLHDHYGRPRSPHV